VSLDSMQKFLHERMEILRAAGRFANWQSEVFLSQGNTQQAFESVLVLLKLSRQVDNDPMVRLNYWLSVALKRMALYSINNFLQAGGVDEQARAALDKELASQDPLETCRKALQSERAFAIEYLTQEKNLQVRQLNTILDIFSKTLRDFSLPYCSYVANHKVIDREKVREYEKTPVYFYSTVTNLQTLIQCMVCDRCSVVALVRSLRIINALQNKPPKSGGSPRMAEIGLPDEVGVDPFNGKPLIIKKLPEGWKVYSVGRNLKDDGGDGCRGDDEGFGPRILKAEAEKKRDAAGPDDR
jgi:hypothetical protein